MNSNSQKGFTLIELILVVVIAGMLAAVAVPSLSKARDAAESAAAVTQLRSMHTNQSIYSMQNNRYARLAELNEFANNAHGTTVGTTLRHRHFTYTMFPVPTDVSLISEYQIIGYRIRDGRVISQYNLREDGTVKAVIQ